MHISNHQMAAEEENKFGIDNMSLAVEFFKQQSVTWVIKGIIYILKILLLKVIYIEIQINYISQ